MITNRKWEEMAFKTFKSPSIIKTKPLFLLFLPEGGGGGRGSASVSAQHSNLALNIQSITSNALELQ